MTLNDYRITSMEFRRLASNMLRPEADFAQLNLIRLKQFIDTNPIIKDIVQKKIEGVEFDFHQCYYKPDSSGWSCIDPPIEESKHIKAQYDYLTYIAESDGDVRYIARNYPCSSNSWNDIIRNFMNDAFKPMIDYVIDTLSKEMMLLEEPLKSSVSYTQHIEKLYGTANQANGDIHSNNTTVNNDIDGIRVLIQELIPILSSLEIDNQKKEDVIDDLDTIEEEIKKDAPKKTKLRKALSGIKDFIVGFGTVISTSVVIAEKLPKLIEMVNTFIGNIS